MNKRIEEIQRKTYVHPSVSWNEAFANTLIAQCIEVIEAQRVGVQDLPTPVAIDMIKKSVFAYFFGHDEDSNTGRS